MVLVPRRMLRMSVPSSSVSRAVPLNSRGPSQLIAPPVRSGNAPQQGTIVQQSDQPVRRSNIISAHTDALVTSQAVVASSPSVGKAGKPKLWDLPRGISPDAISLKLVADEIYQLARTNGGLQVSDVFSFIGFHGIDPTRTPLEMAVSSLRFNLGIILTGLDSMRAMSGGQLPMHLQGVAPEEGEEETDVLTVPFERTDVWWGQGSSTSGGRASV